MPIFLKNWKLSLLTGFALLIAGFFFYQWAYERGAHAVKIEIEKLNAAAARQEGDANRRALSSEIREAENRTREHTELDITIGNAHEPGADDPAPALDQLYYDRVRRYQAATAGN